MRSCQALRSSPYPSCALRHPQPTAWVSPSTLASKLRNSGARPHTTGTCTPENSSSRVNDAVFFYIAVWLVVSKCHGGRIADFYLDANINTTYIVRPKMHWINHTHMYMYTYLYLVIIHTHAPGAFSGFLSIIGQEWGGAIILNTDLNACV